MARVDLDAVARVSRRMSESQETCKCQLEPLWETWTLFENVKEAAKKWEMERMGKRKREHDDFRSCNTSFTHGNPKLGSICNDSN